MPSPVQKLSKVVEVDIDQTDGATDDAITSAINLAGHILVGVIMPATWTAAGITFEVSDTEAGTYVDLYDTSGAELALSAAASIYLAVDPVNFYGVNFLKVRSGTSATPVDQTTPRTLKLLLGVPDRS